MFFIAYTFKGLMHEFAGRVKIVSHSSCRTSAILIYFCPLYREVDITYKTPQKSLLSFFPIKPMFWAHKETSRVDDSFTQQKHMFL